MSERNSVTDIIREVVDEMCTNYCKFPEKYTSDEWEEKYEEICAYCPLNRL